MRSADRWKNRTLNIGVSLAVNAAILCIFARVLAAPSKPAESYIAVELAVPVRAKVSQPAEPKTVVVPPPQPHQESPRRSPAARKDPPRPLPERPGLPRLLQPSEPREKRTDDTEPAQPNADRGQDRAHVGGTRALAPSADGSGAAGSGGSGTASHGPGAPSAQGKGGSGGTIVGGNGGDRSVVTAPPSVNRQPEPKKADPPPVKPQPPAPKGESRGVQPSSQPQPAYPADARDDGTEGTVVLIAVVGTDGKVAETRIEKGSGDRRLDAAAERGVRRWTYKPALKDGVPVRSSVRVRVEFRLE